MSARRVVICYDLKDGRVVKGISFVALQDQGDPAELATGPATAGADELVFLDIDAANSDRALFLDAVRRATRACTVPVTIGGGIRSVDDVEAALAAGAAKVGIASAIVRNPGLIDEAARRFGSERIVACIDARRVDTPDAASPAPRFEVFTAGGQQPTGLEASAWARECADRGAGEILLTSIDRDGQRYGFDLELTELVARAVQVPVTASGGAGSDAHFVELFQQTSAAAGLGAGIFHDGTTTAARVKAALARAGIPIRQEANQ